MRAALVAPERCADQADLLRAFDLPIALLQDAEALDRAAEQLVRAKAAENVAYLEMRWGPHLHTAKGLTQTQVIAAVAAGARRAAAETGIEVRLIVTALRSHSMEENRDLATAAVAAQDLGVVAFDLAGREAAFPDPLTFKESFDIARSGGLAITLHAGSGAVPRRCVAPLRCSRRASLMAALRLMTHRSVLSSRRAMFRSISVRPAIRRPPLFRVTAISQSPSCAVAVCRSPSTPTTWS